MPNYAYIAVALRAVGIWIVLTRGFLLIRFAWDELVYGNSNLILASLLDGSVAWVVFGVALLIWPKSLARLLTPRRALKEKSPEWSPEEFERVALSVVGVFVLATSLTMQTVYFETVVGTITKILIGLWLLLGTKGWFRLFRIVRRAGVTEFRS